MSVRAPVPAVDVHTHLFPDRLMAAVRRALAGMYGWSFPVTSEPEPFAALLRRHGIERFVVLPYAHKPGMAHSLNAWIAETCARLPGAIGFACVHPEDDVAAVLAEAFGAGLRGLKLHHQVQEVAPDDPRLFPVYEEMLARDLPMLVHAGKGPTDNGLVGAAPFRRAMERYPDLRICVAHLGGPEVAEFVAMLADFPRLHLDTSGIGARRLTGLGLERVWDRLLFGSDAPNVRFEYPVAIERVTDLRLPPDAERAVFRDNALEFLGPDRPGSRPD